jgi:hypothetical protein
MYEENIISIKKISTLKECMEFFSKVGGTDKNIYY